MRRIPQEILNKRKSIDVSRRKLRLYMVIGFMTNFLWIAAVVCAIVFIGYGFVALMNWWYLAIGFGCVVPIIVLLKSDHEITLATHRLGNKIADDRYVCDDSWEHLKHSIEFVCYADFEERIKERMG